MPVTINSDSSLVEVYQTLLRSEWSNATLGSTLALLWAEVEGQAPDEAPEWWAILDPNSPGPKNLSTKVLTRISLLADVLSHPAVPPAPVKCLQDDSQTALQAEQAWIYLIFQQLHRVEGDAGFLADTQSLLFLNCVEVLLPALQAEKLQSYHAYLLNALYSHSFLVWRNKPTHMYYLQSILMDYLEAWPERFRLMELALRNTPSTNHEFLTKVQTFWNDLLDFKEYKRAESFLLDVHRVAAVNDLPEIKEMFFSTIQLLSAENSPMKLGTSTGLVPFD